MQKIPKYKIFTMLGPIAKNTPADPLSKIQTNRIVQNVPLGLPDVAHKKSRATCLWKGGSPPGLMQQIPKYKIFTILGPIAKNTPADPLSKIQTNRIVQNVTLGLPDVAHQKYWATCLLKGGVTPGTYATNTEIQDFYYIGTHCKNTPADPCPRYRLTE